MISDGINRLYKVGRNNDVIACVLECYNDSKFQTSLIVESLQNEELDIQCRSIFEYLLNNVTYVVDPDVEQYVKTPARLLADAEGDCKSMSIFIASCLTCLHIPFCFRFVSFSNKYGKIYTHVYIVAYPDSENQIILDPVERNAANRPVYNYSRPYKEKKDFYFNTSL